MTDKKKVIANPDAEWGNIELPGISDDELYNKKWAQVAALKGRKRPDQSQRMKGDNNPMYGVEHPNKGKKMPQISAKTKGKKKPEGFGEKISSARKGKPNTKAQGVARPEHSKLMADPKRNKGAAAMKEMHTCPHCGKIANLPNYKRWHGDNCKAKPIEEQWGNIELPGLSDEELLNTNWNHVAANKAKREDPEFRKRTKKRNILLAQDPIWIENHRKAIEVRSADPEWHKVITDGAKKRSKDDGWQFNVAEANRKKAKDPDWLKKTREQNKIKGLKRRKHIVTPFGIFPGRIEAINYYNKMNNCTGGRDHLCHRVKHKPEEYYYISKEEYIMITGKDI